MMPLSQVLPQGPGTVPLMIGACTKPTLLLSHPKEMTPRPDPMTSQGKKLAWKGARIFTQGPFSELPGDPGFTGNRKPFSKVG